MKSLSQAVNESFINESELKIKSLAQVKIGDMAHQHPDYTGYKDKPLSWQQMGKVLWKGTVAQLEKVKKFSDQLEMFKERHLPDKWIKSDKHKQFTEAKPTDEILIVKTEGMGYKVAYPYNAKDPQSVVVYEN